MRITTDTRRSRYSGRDLRRVITRTVRLCEQMERERFKAREIGHLRVVVENDPRPRAVSGRPSLSPLCLGPAAITVSAGYGASRTAVVLALARSVGRLLGFAAPLVEPFALGVLDASGYATPESLALRAPRKARASASAGPSRRPRRDIELEVGS